MGWIAVKALKFGGGHIAPGEAVPLEHGRDYRIMERAKRIRWDGEGPAQYRPGQYPAPSSSKGKDTPDAFSPEKRAEMVEKAASLGLEITDTATDEMIMVAVSVASMPDEELAAKAVETGALNAGDELSDRDGTISAILSILSKSEDGADEPVVGEFGPGGWTEITFPDGSTKRVRGQAKVDEAIADYKSENA